MEGGVPNPEVAAVAQQWACRKPQFGTPQFIMRGQCRHAASETSTRSGIKTAAVWTGANEKTVKNWFSGRYGPSGEHLVALARHSDEVLGTFLAMAGRENLMVVTKLVAAEEAIQDLLAAVRSLGGKGR